MTEAETEAGQYYVASLSWVDDRVRTERRMRKIAWGVAAAAGTLSLVLAITMMLMMPLKSVQPYVVTVDQQTGAVEVATTLKDGKLSENEAVIQAELANYVRTRETFDATDLATSYRRVQLRSSGNVRSAYVAAMAADNPASPLRALSPGDTVTVRIKSVSLVGQGAGLVRFDAERSAAGGKIIDSRAYVSAVSFGFNDRPLRLEDRFDNPLGFVVMRYRRDAEGATQ